ncbi:MAG: quinone oxidoreductase [Labilithrix sp.]|nr:quinone oxidoreductase [Labilithrix sp.]
MAKVVRIREYGTPGVLSIEDVPVGAPGPREVLLRQTVIGLNFVDVYLRRGTYQVPAFPATLGKEAAGVVAAIGSEVTEVKVGDRVVYADDPLGAYATERVYPVERLVAIPAGISDERAAASFLKGTTAKYLLKDVVRLASGDTVLFHAAAGGVGRIFVQWAKALGIRVIGTVSSPAKAAFAREAGCVAVIDSSREDIAARVRELTEGRGVKAVFDSVGKDTFRASLESLAPRGTLVAFGQASGDSPALNPFELAARSLFLTWTLLPVYTATRAELQAAADELFAAIAAGHIDATPTRTYAFDEIAQAHRDLEERRTTGAAILRV